MKFNRYIVVPLMAISLVSCEKDFLDQKPITDPAIDQVFSSQESVELLVVGGYEPMLWEFNPEFGDSYSMPYIFTDVRSDDVIIENYFFQPHSHDFERFTLESTNINLEGIWSKYFTGAARANQLIRGLGSIEDGVLTEEVYNEFLGEAHFLRAFYYFELVRNFGDVPLFDEAPIDILDEERLKRASADEVYAQINADYQLAADLLPVVASAEGRATQGAALGLLAKAYLYQEKWDLAAEKAQEVIDLRIYSLEQDYSQNFKVSNEFGQESIFEINYTGEASDAWTRRAKGSLTAQFFSPWMKWPVQGWSYNLVTPELQQAFKDEGDSVRFYATVITAGSEFPDSPWMIDNDYSPIDSGFTASYIDAANGQQYGTGFAYSRKYFLNPEEITELVNYQLSNLNHKVLRYAEVLLILAEATLNGAAGDGQAAFDQVRARAGLASKPLTYEALKLERRLELATEWNRFHDLVRWGDAVNELEGFQVGRDELLPIPFNEILLVGTDAEGNYILTQNPNY